jgi:hypothetical protein
MWAYLIIFPSPLFYQYLSFLRQWVQERQEYIAGSLAQLGREVSVVISLKNIRDKFLGRLDELTESEWRELFITLNLEITTKGTPEEVRVPMPPNRSKKLSDFNLWDYVLLTDKIEATISVPLDPEPMANILFTKPGCFKRNRYILKFLV